MAFAKLSAEFRTTAHLRLLQLMAMTGLLVRDLRAGKVATERGAVGSGIYDGHSGRNLCGDDANFKYKLVFARQGK